MSTPAGASFADRQIGTAGRAQPLLDELGYATAGDLVRAAMPADILLDRPETLPAPVDERTMLAELRELANRNRVTTSLIGQGWYGTITPAVIRRNVFENPRWYTAYTPYQPEISQGRLEALLDFQSMIASLTGLDVANASLLDEGTAVAEAMLLARRAARAESAVFAVDSRLFAASAAVLRTRAAGFDIELVEFDATRPDTLPECFGAVVQYPGADGEIVDLAPIAEAVHARKGLLAVAADPLALTLLPAPGGLGADIAVGSAQRFGVPMGFGGPSAGYMAVTDRLVRKLPGRLVGVTRDAAGRPALRLTLQTREQHIRRERATSNICTAQVLLAIMAAMYAVWHGPDGLRTIASRVAGLTAALADALTAAGHPPVAAHAFDTLRINAVDADAVVAAAAARGIDLWRVDASTVSLSLDETTTPQTVAAVAEVFGAGEPDCSALGADAALRLLPGLRDDDILPDAAFHQVHSETEMMRFLARLADRDYALDRGMIPLGSCTMKLNSAAVMEAVSWPEFADIHPYAPAANTAGYRRLIGDLGGWLAEITGYDAVSLQPNAGSQGEYSGLLAIRGYLESQGQPQRTVCLIPESAHGTNAASAAMAGFQVVVVGCDERGSVDVDDLRAKLAAHDGRVAALMVTYPSTHGAYETRIRETTSLVHAAGAQVYIDGANLNALLGFARFGDIGGDVSHLNLHKTFAIPHGGGGPGVGPVAAKAHLAPFLPGHPLLGRQEADGRAEGAVASAPYGSAGVLPISWAFIRMLGADGLRRVTEGAVLNANYVAHELADSYPILYTGAHGLVGHECILDLRPLTARTGITIDDVAKRLNDYGFHAPTMSFPVHGTFMVEPTESEDRGELDRFIAAMRSIRAEADRVAAGEWPADDNPLVNAPHTAAALVGEWTHPYSRETAVYPFLAGLGAEEAVDAVRDKYWTPVARVDNAYGDRHLVCSCPPPEYFEQPLD
ncbi:MAG: aminomethyl-transferring glycine dehydrogenase [Pseudoclavibacter sp.]